MFRRWGLTFTKYSLTAIGDNPMGKPLTFCVQTQNAWKLRQNRTHNKYFCCCSDSDNLKIFHFTSNHIWNWKWRTKPLKQYYVMSTDRCIINREFSSENTLRKEREEKCCYVYEVPFFFFFWEKLIKENIFDSMCDVERLEHELGYATTLNGISGVPPYVAVT